MDACACTYISSRTCMGSIYTLVYIHTHVQAYLWANMHAHTQAHARAHTHVLSLSHSLSHNHTRTHSHAHRSDQVLLYSRLFTIDDSEVGLRLLGYRV
jgi:hypothetical protein